MHVKHVMFIAGGLSGGSSYERLPADIGIGAGPGGRGTDTHGVVGARMQQSAMPPEVDPPPAENPEVPSTAVGQDSISAASVAGEAPPLTEAAAIGSNALVPARTSALSSPFAAKILLLAVGGCAIAALFLFGYADDFQIRLVLALAAAGIASSIPGIFDFHSGPVKAGGAIAVFVFVMLAEHIGGAIGGRATTPGTPANVSFSKNQVQYQAEIASAQFAFVQKNYPAAIEILQNVRRANPKDSFTLHMLGSAYFQLKNYSRAAETFKAGFDMGGPGAGRFAYNAALSYDAMHQIDRAKKLIEDAVKVQTARRDDFPNLWRETIFLRGLLFMVEGLDEKASLSRPGFEAAVASFLEFLDSGGTPLVWADYNLACVHAKTAVTGGYPSGPLTAAIDHFTKFLIGLRSMTDQEQREESFVVARKILVDDHKAGSSALRGPGESKECRAIKDVWTKAGKDWKKDVMEAIGVTGTAAAQPSERFVLDVATQGQLVKNQ